MLRILLGFRTGNRVSEDPAVLFCGHQASELEQAIAKAPTEYTRLERADVPFTRKARIVHPDRFVEAEAQPVSPEKLERELQAPTLAQGLALQAQIEELQSTNGRLLVETANLRLQLAETEKKQLFLDEQRITAQAARDSLQARIDQLTATTIAPKHLQSPTAAAAIDIPGGDAVAASGAGGITADGFVHLDGEGNILPHTTPSGEAGALPLSGQPERGEQSPAETLPDPQPAADQAGAGEAEALPSLAPPSVVEKKVTAPSPSASKRK